MEHSFFDSNQYPQVMVLLDYTAGRCCLYRAMVRNELPISGLDSTDVYIYKGALLPVELSRRHPQIVVYSSPGRADHTYLDTCCNPKRSSNMLPDGAFLVLFY